MNKSVLEELRLQGYAPRTLLDVGAHIGTFAQEFLQVFPDCAATLIEPNPFCQEDLARLAFERHAVAASDMPGRAELFLTKEWLQSTGSSLYRENTLFFRDDVVIRHEVEKVRLDDLFAGRRFDFVKIDTQGSELDVLRGGEKVLAEADYILVEVSLVEYNIGGARAEAVFAQLAAMGFKCADVTEFHRLNGIEGGNLLQMDFLFERRGRRCLGDASGRLDGLRALSRTLLAEARTSEALLLLEHLASLDPRHIETLQLLARTAGAAGEPLKAIEKLTALRAVTADPKDYADDFRALVPAAVECLNAHIAAGEMAEAERYAAALADLLPGSTEILNSALSANLALGRKEKAARYLAALQRLEAAQAATLAEQSAAGISKDDRIARTLSPANEIHPLIRLRDIHDLISAILCETLDDHGVQQVGQLLKAAQGLAVDVPQGSEFEGWLKHYRLALEAIDLPLLRGPTPEPSGNPKITLATSTGRALTWSKLKANARRLGAKTIFFAAADRKYVDLYARWYVESVLAHCDVPFLIVLQVIGGGAALKDIARSLAIADERLILAGDDFDAARVTTRCYDTPPKGLVEVPVAHFQSMRFIALGSLLRHLELPVFVSDIDLLLQRGVGDLLEKHARDDIVLNLNTHSTSAGSRFTANLLLANPTENALLFQRFLQAYLERALARPEVSRWIDQFGLMMARQHLARMAGAARIAYFDTDRDINNVMYPSYQENPFRFLSLYHGFDMTSLKAKPAQRQAIAAAG
ncbi:MAG TPA: FkbM family methyltransferase [Rhizomicrobium sp.]|nr:FkbM family methyltransferase [Rhizomicrobium sp.]